MTRLSDIKFCSLYLVYLPGKSWFSPWMVFKRLNSK